jgi:hypothetical protein
MLGRPRLSLPERRLWYNYNYREAGMKRSFGFVAAVLVLMAGSVDASVKPVLLKNFGELRTALEEGRRVRVVFQYKRMELFIKGKKAPDIPDAFFFRDGEGP